MAIKLKQFRVSAGLTQAKLAAAVGVSQPNYQRWESKASPVPVDKLKKLAKVLKTSTDALLGRHPPISAGFYDDSCGEDLNYYGEVAIHFQGGGRPILLSISDGAFSRLQRGLQSGADFVSVESLSNQLVVIRVGAVADLYFSSEAYDTYGPEHGSYDDQVLPHMPDARDWEIVEALSCDDEIMLDGFSPEDIARVSKAIMITDDQYQQLVAEGHIELEQLEEEKRKNKNITEQIFSAATNVRYQFSNGRQRDIAVFGAEEVYEAFWPLVEFDGALDEDLLVWSIEGWHRSAFINKSSLDYVMIPAHIFERGQLEVEGKILDESA